MSNTSPSPAIVAFDNYQIRMLTEADLLPFFSMVDRNRSRLETYFVGTASKTKTLDDTRQFLKEITERVNARTYFPYIIEDVKNNRPAGFLDLKNIDWNIPKAEIGCYMDKGYAGKRIARKALKLFCLYCFIKLDFNKLFLRTHESNTAARKLAESAGFEVEGILRKDYKTSAGELVDLMYYGKLAD